MGRTIWYELHLPRQLEWAEWKEIRAAEAVMNHRCTWTCEELSLEPPHANDSVMKRSGDRGLDLVATGFTKVGGNEWNAALVVAFAMWLSRRFREGLVRVSDEGDYLVGPARFLREGEFTLELDLERIDRHRDFLVEMGGDEYLAELEVQVAAAKSGSVFNPISVFDYRKDSEIVALGLSEEELRSLTVSDVARRLPIPWFDTSAKAT